MKKVSYILLAMILVLSFSQASASSFIYSQNNPVNIKISCFDVNNTLCTPATSCQITINYPNSSNLISNRTMTTNGIQYNYTLNSNQTSVVGVYPVVVNCIGSYNGFTTFTYEITGNGKAPPSGAVIVMFAVAFLLIMFFIVFFFVNSIGHLAKLDFDVMDLSKSWGSYFVLFGLYMLSLYYLGNLQIESFLLVFIQVGAFTHVIVPMFAFIISITAGSLARKRFDGGIKRFTR